MKTVVVSFELEDFEAEAIRRGIENLNRISIEIEDEAAGSRYSIVDPAIYDIMELEE